MLQKNRLTCAFLLGLTALGVCPFAPAVPVTEIPDGYPTWWFELNVVNENELDEPDNYAMVNQGQAKWMAQQGIKELDDKLRMIGGAGFTLSVTDGLLNNDPAENYAPLNLGQLKNLSHKFYQRFAEIGFGPNLLEIPGNGIDDDGNGLIDDVYPEGWPTGMTLISTGGGATPLYPWASDQAVDNYAPVTLGQLKHLFSWNLNSWVAIDTEITTNAAGDDVVGDGIPDFVEYNKYGSLDVLVGRDGDADHDWVSNYDELDLMPPTNPTVYRDDTTAPTAPANVSIDGALIDFDQAFIRCDPATDTSGINRYVFLLKKTSDPGDHVAMTANRFPATWIKGLEPDTQYSVQVVAYDNAGQESLPSVAATFTTGSKPAGLGTQLAVDDTVLLLKDDGRLYGWGISDYLGVNTLDCFGYASPMPTPINTIEDVVKVVSAGKTYYAIKSDGTLWAWGLNTASWYLGLGEGGDSRVIIPEQLTFSDPSISYGVEIVDVISREYTTLALDQEGHVWSWGNNSSSYNYLARSVTGDYGYEPGLAEDASGTPLSNIKAIAISDATGDSFFALYQNENDASDVNNGKVYGWGSPQYDGHIAGTGVVSFVVLEDDNTVELANVQALYSGSPNGHVVAKLNNGELWTWGYISSEVFGQGPIGSGLYEAIAVKKDVDGDGVHDGTLNIGSSGKVYVGHNYTIAVDDNGQLWAWGSNSDVLGMSIRAHDYAEPLVLPGDLGMDELHPGAYCLLVTTDTGDIYGLGANHKFHDFTNTSNFLISNDLLQTSYSPVLLQGVSTKPQVAMPYATVPGGAYIGHLKVALGTITYGATIHYTTDGSEPDQHSPILLPNEVIIVEDEAVIKAIAYRDGYASSQVYRVYYSIGETMSASDHNVYALYDDVYLWGSEGNFALGKNSEDIESSTNLPATYLDLPLAYQVQTGGLANIYLAHDGSVKVWGNNQYGELGLGFRTQGLGLGELPTDVFFANTSDHWAYVSFSNLNAIAFDQAGSLWSWGREYHTGNLGRDTTIVDHYIPAKMPAFETNVAHSFTQAQITGRWLMALDQEGYVWSWGRNGDISSSVPMIYPGLSGIVQIAVGSAGVLQESMAAFLRADGTVWWIENRGGFHYPQQLMADDDGDGYDDRPLDSIIRISAGNNWLMALDDEGRVWTFRHGSSDAVLGIGENVTSLQRDHAQQVRGLLEGLDVTWIEAGNSHALASVNGSLFSWGYDNYGQLGNDVAAVDAYWPALVSNLHIDLDEDGMADWFEAKYGIDNPYADQEANGGDGLTNLQEYELYLKYGNTTDPLSSDTDGDGLSDGFEVSYLNPADPSEHLNPFVGDTDGDGFSDLVEIENGTNPFTGNADADGDGLDTAVEDVNGNGMVDPGETDPFMADTDGDGWNDGVEVSKATDPLDPDSTPDGYLTKLAKEPVYDYITGGAGTVDTDGDGWTDYEEDHITLTNKNDPNEFTGVVVDVLDIVPATYTGRLGAWSTDTQGEVVYSRDIRGWLEYDFTLAQADIYALEIGLQRFSNLASGFDTTLLEVYIDGQPIGLRVVDVSGGGEVTVRFILPYLSTGDHTLRISWLNDEESHSIQINSIKIRDYAGNDGNGNGIADWKETRLANLYGPVGPDILSHVSPYCHEDASFYPHSLVLHYWLQGDAANPIPLPVLTATYGVYYTDVPLNAGTKTILQVSEQSGFAITTREITWEALDIITADRIRIRKDDTLRFKVAAADATPMTNVSITIKKYDGENFASVHTGSMTIQDTYTYQFTGDGTYQIVAQYTNTSSQLIEITYALKVIHADLGPDTFAQIARWRDWSPVYLSQYALLESDYHLSVRNKQGDQFSVNLTSQQDAAIVARTQDNGAIIDVMKLAPLKDYSYSETAWQVIDTFDDNYQLVEATLSFNAVPDDLIVQLRTVTGATFLATGTTEMIVTAADFDELGTLRYYLIVPPGKTSSCHWRHYYEDDGNGTWGTEDQQIGRN